MIGVKFTRQMTPYGIGDTALLPDAVASKVIDDGAAERFAFPASPHAHEAGADAPDVVMHDKPRTYQTKRARG